MADYISREEVMSAIANMQVEHHYDAANLEDRYVVAHLLEVADKIKEIKSADVQPVKHGRWIEHCDDLFPLESTIECGVCGERENMDIHNDNYCPNCGARMGLKDGEKHA